MSEWGVANHIVQVNGLSGCVQVIDEITLSARGAGEVSYRIKETDFLWSAAVAVSTGIFAHRCESKTESRYFDNDFVCSEDFWGLGVRPLRHAPKFIPLNGELTFYLIDRSNATNTIALYLIGQRAATCGKPSGKPDKAGGCPNPTCRCDRARWGQGRGLYVLSTPGPTLAPSWVNPGIAVPAGGSKTAAVKIPDYYHFRASILNGNGQNGAGGVTANTDWKATHDRQDPRDERRGYITSAQNKQMRAQALVGSAQYPNYLPSPIVGHKGSQFTVDATDLGGSTTNYVSLTWIGETLGDADVELGN